MSYSYMAGLINPFQFGFKWVRLGQDCEYTDWIGLCLDNSGVVS